MSKINFQTYPIKDLSWGINLNDARTEVDEKQCLKAEGFNFKAWKLIWGETKTNQSTYSGNLQGIYYDYTDIYTVSDGSVYKNWTILYSSWNYTLTFGSIDWIPFSINIGWVTKTYFYNTWVEATNRTNLRNQLIIDYPTYTFSVWTWNAITISKGTSFTISNWNLVKKIDVDIDSWSIEKSFDITIDWVTKTIAPWTYAWPSNIYTYLIAQYSTWYYWRNNWDWTFLFAKTDSTDSTYSITNKNTYSYQVRYAFWQFPSSTTYLAYNTPPTVRLTIDWNNYDYTKTFFDNWYYWYNIYDAIYPSISGTFNKTWTKRTWLGEWSDIFLHKTDYSAITLSSTSYFSDYYHNNTYNQVVTDWQYTPWQEVIKTTHTSTASIQTEVASVFTSINNWTWLNSTTLYRLYKSNYWLLFIWFLWDLWARFVDFSTSTWTAIAWYHTIGTVYNSKIFLGWKILTSWLTDNIEFSKTWNITQPQDIITFTWYDSWSQAVSAGNPWYLTWFLTWENWLYIFKNNSVYQNTKGDEFKWETKNTVTWIVEYALKYNFKQVTNTWAYSQECIAQYWQEIFYFDWINKSIRRLRYEEQQQTLRDTAISHEIDTLLKAIPEPTWGYKHLHSLTFKYPNLEFNYCSTNNFHDNSFWSSVNLPDKQVVYNVETSGRLTRSLSTNKIFSPILANNWYYINLSKEVFYFWGKVEYWEFESKVYTLNWVDSLYKRFGWFDIVGSLIPDSWETKTLEIQILINWILEETRTITSTTNLLRFRERIDLYYDWQDIQFKLIHSGKGDLEITDCYISNKQLPYYQSEFY
jgi:hypothetical protein